MPVEALCALSIWETTAMKAKEAMRMPTKPRVNLKKVLLNRSFMWFEYMYSIPKECMKTRHGAAWAPYGVAGYTRWHGVLRLRCGEHHYHPTGHK